jgi:biopolymer transport protein ExbD
MGRREFALIERARSFVWSPSQAAAQRAAKRRSSYYASINVWPFLAVTVTLLSIFFVMPWPSPSHHGLPIHLPRSNYAALQRGALREDAMRISITRNGDVFFRNFKIVSEELPRLIHDALQEGSERKVYLAVDVRSKYGTTASVIEQFQAAGISQVCFLAEKSERW